jgi:hypothetical protein
MSTIKAFSAIHYTKWAKVLVCPRDRQRLISIGRIQCQGKFSILLRKLFNTLLLCI